MLVFAPAVSPARPLFRRAASALGALGLLACGASDSQTNADIGAGGTLAAAGSTAGHAAGGNAGDAAAGGDAGGRAAGGSAGLAAGGVAGEATAGASGESPVGPTEDGSLFVAGPGVQAWNWGTGILNVDYDSYLSKQDLVYSEPNANPLYGLTVGNGRVGAMVWSENGLTMQVGGVDLAEQSTFGAGLVSLQTTPALDAGAGNFEQRLDLYDGTLVTRYGDDRVVTILGSPKSEVLGIHVEDARAGVTTATIDLSLWDVSALVNHAAAPDLNTWKTVTSFAEDDIAGFSRGQTDSKNFGYTLAATVEGADFTTEQVGGDHVRLHITPSPSYTVWLVAASRLNAANHDSVTEAHSALAAVGTAGHDATHTAFTNFWHDFWGKSFVQFSDDSGDADYLEAFYYLSTYVIAAGGYGNYPVHFINGVFRATHDDTKWSNAYWYWNQRDVYHSFLASNHPELVDTFNNLYARNQGALRAFTQTRYGSDGIWVPETMGFDGNADGTVGSDYTQDILSTATEVALNMYDQYRYTGDADYLQNVAYPFLRDAANLYVDLFTYDNGSDRYTMQSSNSHETYWDVQNAITDLVSVRKLFPIVVQVSQELGLDEAARVDWNTLLAKVVDYPGNGEVYLPHTPPLTATKNGENVACELIWPYGVTGLGAPDYDRAVATFNARPFPYGNVWANDAIQAARLGLGDQAYQGMKTMIDRYQNYPNGFTTNTNGVFEYWGVHLIALNESLLHSHDEKIRVLPALPGLDGLTTRFTLAAKGGFLVSAEREPGEETKYVGIKSLNGEQAIVVNPWPGQEVQVVNMLDDSIVTSTADPEITFETQVSGAYALQRTTQPLSDLDYGHIESATGANDGVKSLSGTSSTLGM